MVPSLLARVSLPALRQERTRRHAAKLVCQKGMGRGRGDVSVWNTFYFLARWLRHGRGIFIIGRPTTFGDGIGISCFRFGVFGAAAAIRGDGDGNDEHGRDMVGEWERGR